MRYPAVAGQFYERDAGALRKQIDGCYRHAIGPGRKPAVARDGARTLKALVVPHAGYVYSGPGAAVALGTHDWETPLGVATYDTDLGASLLKEPLTDDIIAHRHEHSI